MGLREMKQNVSFSTSSEGPQVGQKHPKGFCGTALEVDRKWMRKNYETAVDL